MPYYISLNCLFYKIQTVQGKSAAFWIIYVKKSSNMAYSRKGYEMILHFWNKVKLIRISWKINDKSLITSEYVFNLWSTLW